MSTEDGSLAKDSLTFNFTRLACHQDKDTEWAGTYTEGIHSLGR